MNPECVQIRVQVIGGSSRCFELHPGTQVPPDQQTLVKELFYGITSWTYSGRQMNP